MAALLFWNVKVYNLESAVGFNVLLSSPASKPDPNAPKPEGQVLKPVVGEQLRVSVLNLLDLIWLVPDHQYHTNIYYKIEVNLKSAPASLLASHFSLYITHAWNN